MDLRMVFTCIGLAGMLIQLLMLLRMTLEMNFFRQQPLRVTRGEVIPVAAILDEFLHGTDLRSKYRSSGGKGLNDRKRQAFIPDGRKQQRPAFLHGLQYLRLFPSPCKDDVFTGLIVRL